MAQNKAFSQWGRHVQRGSFGPNSTGKTQLICHCNSIFTSFQFQRAFWVNLHSAGIKEKLVKGGRVEKDAESESKANRVKSLLYCTDTGKDFLFFCGISKISKAGPYPGEEWSNFALCTHGSVTV